MHILQGTAKVYSVVEMPMTDNRFQLIWSKELWKKKKGKKKTKHRMKLLKKGKYFLLHLFQHIDLENVGG